MLQTKKVTKEQFVAHKEACLGRFIRNKFCKYSNARYQVKMNGANLQINFEAAPKPFTASRPNYSTVDFAQQMSQNGLYKGALQGLLNDMIKDVKSSGYRGSIKEVFNVKVVIFNWHFDFTKKDEETKKSESIAVDEKSSINGVEQKTTFS